MQFLLYKDTAKVAVPSIDQPDSDLVKFSDRLMIIKVPGHGYTWTGGGQGYAKITYQIIEIESVKSCETYFDIRGNTALEFRGKDRIDEQGLDLFEDATFFKSH